MRQWRLVLAWLTALVLATTLTWQIVSAADDRIGIRAGAPLDVAAPSLPGSTAATVASVPGTTTTAGAPGTTPTTPSGTIPTAPSGTTPTTDAAPGGELVVIPTTGGTVTVRVANGNVTYVSAVPNQGFAVEVDDFGPPEVRVEFVGAATEVEVRARWHDGSLDLRVDVD